MALNRRIEYIFKDKICTDCYMGHVMKTMMNYHKIPDELRWNSNLRCFLSNHITLAKLITFRYYFANLPVNFSIENQIDSFEDINYLLNGNLFLNEQSKNAAFDKGYNLFNLFGHVEIKTNHPTYFLYTRLLQLISKNENISEERIMITTDIFGYKNDDVIHCLDKMVFSGLIKSTYTPKVPNKIKFQITSKGEFALFSFFNDIHYLYYSCLDTLLPNNLIKEIKVSPNNFSTDLVMKRYYAPFSIQTGILFLQFLIGWNNMELKLVRKRNKNIDIHIFDLPVEREKIRLSIEKMVDISFRDDDYRQELNNYASNLLKQQNLIPRQKQC